MVPVDDFVVLYHGTTLGSAQSIIENGWQTFHVQPFLQCIAHDYGENLADMLDDLRRFGRFAVVEDGRGDHASFATTLKKAEHNWAQRAPEARWEALWCIYRLKYMTQEEADFWPKSVPGHTWVWKQMRHEELAVIRLSTTLEELVDAGAFDRGSGERKLANRELFELFPEIRVNTPFRPSADRLEIIPIARHLPFDVYAEILEIEPEDFKRRAERGDFGKPASDGVESPGFSVSVPWWDSSAAPFVGPPSTMNSLPDGEIND